VKVYDLHCFLLENLSPYGKPHALIHQGFHARIAREKQSRSISRENMYLKQCGTHQSEQAFFYGKTSRLMESHAHLSTEVFTRASRVKNRAAPSRGKTGR